MELSRLITRAQEGDWAVNEMERLHVDVALSARPESAWSAGSPRPPRPLPRYRRQKWPRESGSSRWLAPTASVSQLSSNSPLLIRFDSIAVAGSPSQAALQPFLERGITITVGGTS